MVNLCLLCSPHRRQEVEWRIKLLSANCEHIVRHKARRDETVDTYILMHGKLVQVQRTCLLSMSQLVRAHLCDVCFYCVFLRRSVGTSEKSQREGNNAFNDAMWVRPAYLTMGSRAVIKTR